jgi:gliding motility-associated-like protein
LWSTGATSPILAAIPNGNYTVWVRDSNNCLDSFKSTVGFDDCCTPFVPNAFSPNNDGRNDIFRVKYKGDVRIIEFSIFNRFGERIFSSSYSDAGWDGTYDGRTCDIGSYFYYIRLICGKDGDQVLEFKGDVTLVR